MIRPLLSHLLMVALLLTLILSAAATGQDTPKCGYCEKTLTGRYVTFQDQSYHQECYQEHVAPRCGVCRKPIVEPNWVSAKGESYHLKCYESGIALRCSVCGEIIEDDYLHDFWDNKYHARHEKEVGSCSFCGRLLVEPFVAGGAEFTGSKQICAGCGQTSVRDERFAIRKLNEVRSRLEEAGIVIGEEEINLELVLLDELNKLIGSRSDDHTGLTVYNRTTSLGLLVGKRFTIYILKGLPLMHYTSSAAHELMHVWQYLNVPEDCEEALLEGSCNYAAYLVLRRSKDKMARYVIRQLHENPDPAYGEGFRRVKKLVDNRSVKFWLDHIQFDPQFPIGY